MIIEFYSLPGCINCQHLRHLFERADVQYTEKVVTEDLSIEEFTKLYSDIDKMPHVVIDGKSIGGLLETVKYFVENKLVK